MKALSGTLEAAQQAASAAPFVECVIRDEYSETSRTRFTRWYTGSETDGPVAAIGAADGSLIRLHNSGGTLNVSRVTTPLVGSTYSSWSNLETVFSGTAVALVRMANDDLWAFYIETDHRTIERKISTDDGATWGAGVAVYTRSVDIDHMCAAADDSGGIVLFWAEAADVYSGTYNGSTWGTATAWSRTVASVTGLAAQWLGDYQVIVAGTQETTDNPRVYAARFGDGFAAVAGVWSSLRSIAEASDGSDVSFSWPGLYQFDGAWRLFFVETFAGDAAYVRVQHATKSFDFDFNVDQWREAVAFDYADNAFGVQLAEVDTFRVMLVASDGVWDAELLDDIDVSADVVAASVDVDLAGARARVELDNADGAYSSYGSGALAALQRGARVELSPGYTTASGNEVTSGQEYAYWVESLELVSGWRPRLVLHCRGADWLASRWRAKRQYTFAAGLPLFGLFFVVAARAGLPFLAIGSTSPGYSALTPAFTMNPGESGLTALRRLAEKVSESLYFDAGNALVINPGSGDSSDYAFGGAHAIVEGRYRDLGPSVNRARVVGDGVLGEAFDFDDIEAFGEFVDIAADDDLDDSGDAEDRAAATLRDAAMGARGDVVRIFGVHCGIELYDVVDVTDAGAGLSSAARRVLGYSWRLEKIGRARYDMTLTLGDV